MTFQELLANYIQDFALRDADRKAVNLASADMLELKGIINGATDEINRFLEKREHNQDECYRVVESLRIYFEAIAKIQNIRDAGYAIEDEIEQLECFQNLIMQVDRHIKQEVGVSYDWAGQDAPARTNLNIVISRYTGAVIVSCTNAVNAIEVAVKDGFAKDIDVSSIRRRYQGLFKDRFGANAEAQVSRQFKSLDDLLAHKKEHTNSKLDMKGIQRYKRVEAYFEKVNGYIEGNGFWKGDPNDGNYFGRSRFTFWSTKHNCPKKIKREAAREFLKMMRGESSILTSNDSNDKSTKDYYMRALSQSNTWSKDGGLCKAVLGNAYKKGMKLADARQELDRIVNEYKGILKSGDEKVAVVKPFQISKS